MINFKGKKILITGATGGIGHALVKKFVSLEGNILATGTKIEKLDVLKKEVMQIENNRITGQANEQEITNTNKNNNNLPDMPEILNRIDEVDTKIKKVEKGVIKNELTNAYFQKRFTNIENTMDRFESLEKEIKIEYEEDDNAFKKNKYLKIFLLLLLLLFLMMIAGDRLGFIDLYIDEIIKSFFF